MAKKPQKVVVQIGHTKIMLPDDTGAAQVIKTLSRGIVVWHWGGARVQLRAEELELGMTYLPEKAQFTDEEDRPLDPEPTSTSTGRKKPAALKNAPLLRLMEGGGR